jgi:hypothetical protein
MNDERHVEVPRLRCAGGEAMTKKAIAIIEDIRRQYLVVLKADTYRTIPRRVNILSRLADLQELLEDNEPEPLSVSDEKTPEEWQRISLDHAWKQLQAHGERLDALEAKGEKP